MSTRQRRNAAVNAFARIKSQATRRRPRNNNPDPKPAPASPPAPAPLSINNDETSPDDQPDAVELENSHPARADNDTPESQESEEEHENSDTESEADPETQHLEEDPPAKETGIGSIRFQGTYAEAVSQEADPSRAVTYSQRRLALMVNIPEVDNNTDRLHHIVEEVNAFMKTARKNNTKFRLRKFDDISTPDINHRTKWRTKLTHDSSADFREYVQGYYPFTAPRGGTYRLRLNTVMDSSVNLHTFLENVTHDWGQKDTRSISDIKSQRIWDPVKIGYLMRAPKYMTHSYEFVDSLEAAANKGSTATQVFFGVSWGTIPSPVGGYDKATAVQAVIIETNKDHLEMAVSLLKKWYPLDPKKAATPPFPGNYRFVLNRDNPRIKGNPIALSNLSVLMERQGIFNKDTLSEQTHCLKDLDRPYRKGSHTSVRSKLLQTKIRTLGPNLDGSPLFLSISTSVNNRSGHKSVWFTYHKKASAEAVSVVRNLPIFIATEWKIDAELVCYAQFINPSDNWDSDHRVANNEDTDDIKLAAEVYTIDLQRSESEQEINPQQPDDTDADSMNTKAKREMKRMLQNDDETVASVMKSRQIPAKPLSIIVRDDESQGGISGVSGTSSKSSVYRAKMKKDFDEKFAAQQQVVDQLKADKQLQQKQQEVLSSQVEALQRQLARLTQSTPIPKSHSIPTVELPPDPFPDVKYDDISANPDFDPTTADADFQELVSSFEQRFISRLDHEPSDDEMLEITIAAQRLASEWYNDGNLPSSSHDSDPINTPSRLTNPATNVFESDDDESMKTEPQTTGKRLASTESDENSTSEDVFKAAGSSSPKKKAHVTGDADPGLNT